MEYSDKNTYNKYDLDNIDILQKNVLQKEAKKLKDKIDDDINKEIEKLQINFVKNIEDIRAKVIDDLARIYDCDKSKIKIIINNKRSLEDQIKHFESWKSQTLTSLHSIWMAVDLLIFVDGVMYGSKAPSWSNAKEKTKYSVKIEPYQIFGYYALQKWYFWWWIDDIWHIWYTKTMMDLLNKKAIFAKSNDINKIYNLLISQKTINIKYKSFVEKYEKINSIKIKKRVYDKDNEDIPWPTIWPINPKTFVLKPKDKK